MATSAIHVFAHWSGMDAPQHMGELRVARSRGKEVFVFSYDQVWLKGGGRFALDPALRLFTGPQYVQEDQPNFGLFLDTAPDRWGRMLMQRREA
ncbi:MAG TPA: type II toxin-antitoxin system HipA family toxin, partial [Flavobacteriales bacterium]|nr:type II toxin-antitoxin system HipA family toxin [Flavobacteriales bacterium]